VEAFLNGDKGAHYPTITQADDGHLLVFRGMHNRELWVARSPAPHSIAGTWTDTQIPEGLGATYPTVVKAADGALFVFVRETAGDLDPAYPTDFRPMKYVRSTDNGRTWASAETLTGQRWAIAPTRPAGQHERGLHRTAAVRAGRTGPAGAGLYATTNDSARVILTGASSARPAEVADGDIYVAGAPALS
jgi:hypothetical protein